MCNVALWKQTKLIPTFCVNCPNALWAPVWSNTPVECISFSIKHLQSQLDFASIGIVWHHWKECAWRHLDECMCVHEHVHKASKHRPPYWQSAGWLSILHIYCKYKTSIFKNIIVIQYHYVRTALLQSKIHSWSNNKSVVQPQSYFQWNTHVCVYVKLFVSTALARCSGISCLSLSLSVTRCLSERHTLIHAVFLCARLKF